LPCQRLNAAPQFWQTKERVDLAMEEWSPRLSRTAWIRQNGTSLVPASQECMFSFCSEAVKRDLILYTTHPQLDSVGESADSRGEASAPDTWVLPEVMDRDQMAKAVEIVLDWYQYGGLAVELVAKLYPVLCSRPPALCPHPGKPSGDGGDGR
jgi:hypothetical protein